MKHIAAISLPGGGSTVFTDPNTFLGTFASRLFQYGIIAAGLYFMVRLIMAGFNLLTSTGDPGKIQQATKILTSAFIGLLIVVSVYFIGQIIQKVFGVNIL